MHTQAIQTAIKFGQLIKLLTPLAKTSKPLAKPLSRLLSRVQSRVVVLACTQDEAIGRLEFERLMGGYTQLMTGVKRSLDSAKLLRASTGYAHVYFHQVKMSARSQKELACLIEELSKAPIAEVAIASEVDAQSRHLYASLVRNANWMPLIADLGTTLSTADKTFLNGELIKRHSSRQGVALYAQRMAKLSGMPMADQSAKTKLRRTTKKAATASDAFAPAPSIDATGLYSRQVVLDLDAVMARPEVASLFMNYPEEDSEGSLAQIIENAAKPFDLSADASFEKVAQALVDDFVGALHARATKREAARKAEQKVLAKKKEEATLAALKQLDPALISALKNNPALLKSL